MAPARLSNGEAIGGPQGEVRYSVAQPVKIKVHGNVDPRTGALLNEVDVNPLEDPEVGSRLQLQGPAGTTFTVYGVYSGNGQRVWTYVDPFSENGRGTTRVDNDGNVVIDYTTPTPTAAGAKPVPFQPADYVNANALKFNDGGRDSTDGTAWDPRTDKETAFNSPMGALANSSSAGMKFVNGLGAEAVTAAEREWYSMPANMTPRMKADIAAGADPQAVIEREAGQLTNSVQSKAYWGFTPEEQQNTRKYLSQRANTETDLRLGLAPGTTARELAAGALDTRRDELEAQLSKWGQGVRAMPMGVRTPGGVVPRSDTWTKAGWNVGDLLSQPGMSLDQANDLAARISGGAVGKLTPDATQEGLPALFGRQGPRRKKPYQNPFLGSGGVVKPKPYVAPKTVSPTSGAVAPPVKPKPVVTVNPYVNKPPPGVNPNTWNQFGGGGPGGSGV